MSGSPEKKEKKNVRAFLAGLMDNNKFVAALSLIIAFFVWAAVAMYKSPEESYTIYNVPITIDTQNTIVAQRNYTAFHQSDDSVDVTVTGPRYLISSLTADDILVSAMLNNVDSPGIAELPLKVSMRSGSQDIIISAQSKTSIDVYFDVNMKQTFDVTADETMVADHIAADFINDSNTLTVSTVDLQGPATEIKKIVSVVATPKYPNEKLFKTTIVPVELSFEGATAADTVSVNRYVTFADENEYFMTIGILKSLDLAPAVRFTGNVIDGVSYSSDVDVISAVMDTSLGEYNDNVLPVIEIDYQSLIPGYNTFTVDVKDIKLPDGLTITDDDVQKIKITVIAPSISE